MTPFKHNLTSDNIEGIQAYGSLLNELLSYVQDATEYNPEKRMIDSVPLLDKISASCAEIKNLLNDAKNKLETIKNKLL